ncbi:MAG: cyclase family protein [Acidimicrobiales bacterium]|jgi:kynurenine formamidase|nr:cyclase family protein [Acidimicrobiales bacterium]
MTDLPLPDSARMYEIFESVKNWGRWGEDDEAGALNLITDDVRRGAAAAVRHGRAVSCARDIPVDPAPDNPHPALHMMVKGGDDCLIPGLGFETTSDFVGLAFHGMASSHLDAFCHVLRDGLMYNGRPAALVKSTGAEKNTVMCAKDGITTRGVLLDMPRALGIDWLEPGHFVDPDQLDLAVSAQNDVEIREGDCLLISLGRDAQRAERGPFNPFRSGTPGLHPECVPWMHERGISVLGSDIISDVLPVSGVEGWAMPVHECTLVAMGVHLLDNLDLSGLMAECAALSQWDFQLTIAPLRIEGGTGSPVNPIAVL